MWNTRSSTTVESIRNNNQHNAEIFGFKMFPVEPLRVKSSKPFFAYNYISRTWFASGDEMISPGIIWQFLTISNFFNQFKFPAFFSNRISKKPPRENWRFEIKEKKKGFQLTVSRSSETGQRPQWKTDVELKVGLLVTQQRRVNRTFRYARTYVTLSCKKWTSPFLIFSKMQSPTTDPPWHIRPPQGGPLYGPHRSHNISEGDEIYFAKGGAQGGWSLVCVGEWDEDIK